MTLSGIQHSFDINYAKGGDTMVNQDKRACLVGAGHEVSSGQARSSENCK